MTQHMHIHAPQTRMYMHHMHIDDMLIIVNKMDEWQPSILISVHEICVCEDLSSLEPSNPWIKLPQSREVLPVYIALQLS